MGQYWKPVNLDKKEYLEPHKFACGLKLVEQLGGLAGTGDALVLLCAAQREVRGGGDFNVQPNDEVVKRVVGRWAGDRIAFIGDYSEDDDLPNSPIPASRIYDCCSESPDGDNGIHIDDLWTDISDDVCAVLERELDGKFYGDGWRKFKRND